MLTHDFRPSVRPLTTPEIDTLLGNLVREVRGPIVPAIIGYRVTRRGVRRDGTKITSPRRKPLFLHVLLSTDRNPGYVPERVWLGDVELRLNSGWASNLELCDRGVELVYCKAGWGRVPRDIVANCRDLRGRPYPGRDVRRNYIYLRLEWRCWAFPTGIPSVTVE